MNCQTIKTSETTYGCAFFCEKKNAPPTPMFRFENFKLIQNSLFFDKNVFFDRLYKWSFFVDDVLCSSIGFGRENESIAQIGSNSTYGSLNLGLNNFNIKNYINNLPSYNLTKKNNIKIKLDVVDCDGVKNVLQSNTYSFNI